MVVIAVVGDRTAIAQRLRPADAPAVQDQRIGGERPRVRRQRPRQLIFHDDRVVRLGDPYSVRHPQHMAIDRQTGNAERMAEDDVRRLPSNSWQLDQGVHARRHVARVPLDERGRHAGQRLRLGTEEAGGLYLRLELGRRRLREGARVGVPLEERRRDAIDALVGALRRENRRDEQLVGIPEVELGERARMLTLEFLEDLAHPALRLHAA
jgi:hypothetical protein